MVGTSYNFRLGPFATDYDAAIQLSEAEERVCIVGGGVLLPGVNDQRAITEAEVFKALTGRD